MSNNVTLGFTFDSSSAQGSLSAFSAALKRALSGVQNDTKSIAQALSGMVPEDLANRIAAIANAFNAVKDIHIDDKSAQGISTIAEALARLDGVQGKGIEALEKFRDAINSMPSDTSKISAGITGVVNAFGGMAGIRADSVNAIAAVMRATASLAAQQRAISPAMTAMRNSITALFRGISREQVPTEKLEAIASFSRAMRGIATETAGDNISASFAAIGRSISGLQSSLQGFSISEEQTDSLTALSRLARAMSGFDTGAAQSAIQLGTAVRLLGESSASLHLDLSQINALSLLARAVRAMPSDAPAKGQAIASMFSALANAAPATANLSGAATNLAALGTALRRIPNSTSAVNNIAQLFNVLQGLEMRFRNLNLSEVSAQFTELGTALRGIKVTRGNARNLETVINLLANFRPLSSEALGSIRTLTDLLQALGHAAVGSTHAMREHSFSLRQVRNEMSGTTMLAQTFGSVLSTQYLREAANDALAFGRELAYVNTIAREFRETDLGVAFKNMASYLGPAQQLANSFYYAYSSGVRGSEEEMLAFTEEMARVSQLIRADVTPTVNAVTGLMNAYGMSVGEADRVSRMLFNTIKYGKALGPELAGSLGMVTPTAAIAKIPIEELGAALASLTRTMPTSNAITALNNLLTKIIRPTSDAAQMAKMYGVELSLAALQTDGLLGTMRKLHDALGDNQDAIAKIFPDIRGIRAAFTLLGNGFDEFSDFTRKFQEDIGSVDDASAELRDNINYQLGALPETFARIRAEAGGMLISVLEPARPLVQAINEMSESWRRSLALLSLGVAGYSAMKIGLMALDAVNRHSMEAEAQRHALAEQRIRDTERITQALLQQVAAETNLSSARTRLLLRAGTVGAPGLNAAEFSSLYLNGSPASGAGGTGVAALAAKRKELAEVARSEALYSAQLSRTALAEGNAAAATVHAANSRRQYTRYLALNAQAQRLQTANTRIQARATAIEEKKQRLLNATLLEQFKLRAQIAGLGIANFAKSTLVQSAEAVRGALATVAAAIASFGKSLLVMGAWGLAFWGIAAAGKALYNWVNRATEKAKELRESMKQAAADIDKWAQNRRQQNSADQKLSDFLRNNNGSPLEDAIFSEVAMKIDALQRKYGDLGIVVNETNRSITMSAETIDKLNVAIRKDALDIYGTQLTQARLNMEKFEKTYGVAIDSTRKRMSKVDFGKALANGLGFSKSDLKKLGDELNKLQNQLNLMNETGSMDVERYKEITDKIAELKPKYEEWNELIQNRKANVDEVYNHYLELYDELQNKEAAYNNAQIDNISNVRQATLDLIRLREKEQEMRREFTESLMTSPEKSNYYSAQIQELELMREEARKTLEAAEKSGDANGINRALLEEQRVANALYDKRVKLFNIQREMAQEQLRQQRQAYDNTVKMVMEMDKFTARTANTFEVGTWEAIDLMSRSFENLSTLPKIEMPQDQTVDLAKNEQLQQLIDINTAIAAGLNGADGKYFGDKLWLDKDFEDRYIQARKLSERTPDNTALSRDEIATIAEIVRQTYAGPMQSIVPGRGDDVLFFQPRQNDAEENLWKYAEENEQTMTKLDATISNALKEQTRILEANAQREETVQKIFDTPEATAFLNSLARQVGVEVSKRGTTINVHTVGR